MVGGCSHLIRGKESRGRGQPLGEQHVQGRELPEPWRSTWGRDSALKASLLPPLLADLRASMQAEQVWQHSDQDRRDPMGGFVSRRLKASDKLGQQVEETTVERWA